MGKVVGFLFTYMSSLIPVRKLINDKQLIGFFHPVPSYDQHILIIPKKIIGSIFDISDEKLFEDIIKTAIDLSERIKWGNDCIVLCANGGKRQDVKQVHFHLFSTKSMYADEFIKDSHMYEIEIESTHQIIVREYKSKKAIEIVNRTRTESDENYIHCLVLGIMETINLLNSKFDLNSTGFTLKLQIGQNKTKNTSNLYIDF
jgi:diadenosine tetraphosphate (Ap4A) HIT family hydrolase